MFISGKQVQKYYSSATVASSSVVYFIILEEKKPYFNSLLMKFFAAREQRHQKNIFISLKFVIGSLYETSKMVKGILIEGKNNSRNI